MKSGEVIKRFQELFRPVHGMSTAQYVEGAVDAMLCVLAEAIEDATEGEGADVSHETSSR